MVYVKVNKPTSNTYTEPSRDVVNYPQYGKAIYGTSKYGRGNPYSSVSLPASTTYTKIAKPV